MFNAFRNTYGFTYYSDHRTPVTFDVRMLSVICISVLVSIATLIATLGIRGRERWFYAIRASYAVAVGSIILVSLVGQDWLVGSVDIQSHYVYRNNRPFIGSLLIRVGLFSANVTLDGYYDGASGRGYVFYSESFPWPEYGQEHETFTQCLTKGLPEPILKVMEYISVDKGGLRWGRTFHKSGYFASVLLWSSFSFWIVSNVLLCSVVVYGAYMSMLTGLTMILSCITYHVSQSTLPLVITFHSNSLQVSYGWCYWLTLTIGCLTCLLAAVLIVADHVMHEKVFEFFQLEKLEEDDFYDVDNMQTPNGSIVPGSPSIERGGSIFLATCRLPRAIKYNSKGGLLSGHASLFSNSLERSPRTSINPESSEEQKVTGRTGHRNSVTFKLQYVDDGGELCLRDIEASMYSVPEDGLNDNSERVSTAGSVDRYPQSHEGSERGDKQYKINITPEGLNEAFADIDGKRWHDGIYQLPKEEFMMGNINGSLESEDLNTGDQCEVILSAENSCKNGSSNRLQVPGVKPVDSRTELDGEQVNRNVRRIDGKRKWRVQDGRLNGNIDTVVNII